LGLSLYRYTMPLPPLLRRRPFLLVACFALVILGAALGVFFIRGPALILSDAYFDALYGPRRALIRQAGLSLRLFRRVKKVLIAENTSPEATVFAIEAASHRPWAVLGHQRYALGLEEYALQHPGVLVSIVRDAPAGEENAETGAAELVFPDTRLNSWRMGRAAALLAGEDRGTVLVFQEGGDFPVNREAFLAGLQESGGDFDLITLDSFSGYSSWNRVSCAVLGGSASAYLDRKDSTPGILYTWMDPALSPSRIKITVDDSVWALALQCFSPWAGTPRMVQAGFTIPRGRVGDSELRKKLKNAFLEQIPGRFP
jgi:hypothetical protein